MVSRTETLLLHLCRQTLLPVKDTNLGANAANSLDTQTSWPDWELDPRCVAYCSQVACAMTLPIMPPEQATAINMPS